MCLTNMYIVTDTKDRTLFLVSDKRQTFMIDDTSNFLLDTIMGIFLSP